MLKLERVVNVTALGDQAKRLNIETEVRRLTGNLRFDRANLLTAEAKQQLRDFAASDVLRVNFTAYSILVSPAFPRARPAAAVSPHADARRRRRANQLFPASGEACLIKCCRLDALFSSAAPQRVGGIS